MLPDVLRVTKLNFRDEFYVLCAGHSTIPVGILIRIVLKHVRVRNITPLSAVTMGIELVYSPIQREFEDMRTAPILFTPIYTQAVIIGHSEVCSCFIGVIDRGGIVLITVHVIRLNLSG